MLLVGPARPRQDDRSRTSSARSSASASARSPGRRSSARATWPRSSPSLEPRDVLFIDEIHRLSPAIEEILYPALEDFRLDIVIGQGPAARTLTLDLPPFTLIGATTRTGLLTTPLRDRFGMTFRLDLLRAGRAGRDRHARRRGSSASTIADEAADEIARRSRGTPRVANRILRRVRDVAEVRHAGEITPEIAARGARAARGRRARASSAPTASCSRRSSTSSAAGRSGCRRWPSSLGEEPDTIEDVYEPYLLQLGFIQRTPRGRIVTDLGIAPRRRRPGGARGSASSSA